MLEKYLITSSAEEAVVLYQQSVKRKDINESEKYYGEIVYHYNPMDFKNLWKGKYGFLYDRDESSFDSDYMFCFVKSINYFKSKTTLADQGKFIQGKGTLANYFRIVLEKHFHGIIKERNTAKRNPIQICPLCNVGVSPLSTHILKEHAADFVWPKLHEIGMEEKSFAEGCPFCPTNVPRRRCKTTDTLEILDHMTKYHSGTIIEAFKEQHPSYLVSNDHTRCASDCAVESIESVDTLEYYSAINGTVTSSGGKGAQVSQNREMMSNFLDMDLTPEENKIIDFIFTTKNVKSIEDGKLTYKKVRMSERKFELTMDSLRDKLAIVGLD